MEIVGRKGVTVRLLEQQTNISALHLEHGPWTVTVRFSEEQVSSVAEWKLILNLWKI